MCICYCGSYEVHRNAGRTPPEAIISGGICGVSEERQGRVRRTLHLGLIVLRPYRACFPVFERKPRACALGCILAPPRGYVPAVRDVPSGTVLIPPGASL